jgi:hypothetical protein
LPGFTLADDGYRMLHDGEIFWGSDWIPLGGAIASLRCRHGLLVLTGPPFSRDKDPELARLVNTFDGRKVVCGGTAANILGRLASAWSIRL